MNIIFAHNCHNRPNVLKNTIGRERDMFKNSLSYLSLSHEGGINDNIFENSKICRSHSPSWQRGCVNGFVSVMSYISVNHHEDTPIIFSHDDVYVVNEKVIIENIKILEKYDFIARRPDNWFPNYYLMDCFYTKTSTIKSLFTEHIEEYLKSDSEIPIDRYNNMSAEVFLYNLFHNMNGYIYDYIHTDVANNYNNYLKTTMGYYHYNAGKTGWIE